MINTFQWYTLKLLKQLNWYNPKNETKYESIKEKNVNQLSATLILASEIKMSAAKKFKVDTKFWFNNVFSLD
jgi:hypothetical protein